MEQPLGLPISILVVAMAVAGGLWDLLFRRIPNWLTYPGVLCGVCLSILPGVDPSLASGAGGLLLGSLTALVFFSLGGLGGGDVKLLAAAGALLGFPLIIDVLLLGATGGCLLALLSLQAHGRLQELLPALRWLVLAPFYRGIVPVMPARDLRVPLGVAIAVAMLITVLYPNLRVTASVVLPTD